MSAMEPAGYAQCSRKQYEVLKSRVGKLEGSRKARPPTVGPDAVGSDECLELVDHVVALERGEEPPEWVQSSKKPRIESGRRFSREDFAALERRVKALAALR